MKQTAAKGNYNSNIGVAFLNGINLVQTGVEKEGKITIHSVKLEI
ncbi:MAG: hypothetical protein AB9836_12415 [Aminipila sp.]